MSGVQISGAVNQTVDSKVSIAETTGTQTFKHSRLGQGVALGVDISCLEEASIAVSSKIKIKNKEEDKEQASLRERIAKMTQKVPDMPGEKEFAECLQKLKDKQQQGGLEEDDIRQALQEYSSDVTHQYLALEELKDYFNDLGIEGDLQDKLQAVADELYKDSGEEIRAGLNVSVAASNFANDKEMTTQELRDMWRQALKVPDFTTQLEAYDFAVAKSGDYQRLTDGIKWMADALSVELGLVETERSIDSVKMLHVRKQLERVFSLQTLLSQCQSVESTVPKVIAGE